MQVFSKVFGLYVKTKVYVQAIWIAEKKETGAVGVGFIQTFIYEGFD